MELIKEAGLLKTVTKIGRCYDRLVKKFVVNLSPECAQEGHEEYKKLYVRGKCVKF